MSQHKDFCLWLKGFADVTQRSPTAQEWRRVIDELDKVLEEKEFIPIPPISWRIPNPKSFLIGSATNGISNGGRVIQGETSSKTVQD